MSTHSSILAWKIPWTEEPGRLQSMGLQRVEHQTLDPDSCSKRDSANYSLWDHCKATTLLFTPVFPSVKGGEEELQFHRLVLKNR